MRLNALVILTCTCPTVLASGLPIVQDFEADLAALRQQGWGTPSTCSVVAERSKSGRRCLEVRVASTQGRYAQLFIPVARGKCYRAEVWIRCRDVKPNPALGQSRGAVIFSQWANAKKGWEPGGAFPKGLFGTRDWVLRKVPLVRPIPARVSYIQLLLGVEGTGTAWFDGLRVEEIREWNGVVMEAPAEGERLDVRRPLLKWRGKAKVGASGALVDLSRDFRFPVDATLRVAAQGAECRPPALEPGVWHWRVRQAAGHGHLPPGQTRSFSVMPGAELWPPTMTPRVMWSDRGPVTLKVRVEPKDLAADFAATIGGRPGGLAQRQDGLLVFRPAQALGPGIHPVRITATKGDRSASVSTFLCNKRPGRTVAFRRDNVMLLDGKPFFPIGAYRDPSDTLTDFSGLIEAGFNTTHSYAFETPKPGDVIARARRYLQTAHEHGLKVFMGMPRPHIDAGDFAWCQRWAAELMDEPALLTWYLRDEPDGAGIPPAKIQRLNDAVKAVDPFTPTTVLCCVPRLFRQYGCTADIFWSDPYPVPRRPLSTVQDYTRKSRAAAGPGRPVWIVIQGFDWTYLRNTKAMLSRHGQPTRPTARETRCMAFTALANGATGLIWYWSPNSILHIQRDAPDVWRGICATVHELQGLMPFLTARSRPEDTIDVRDPLAAWSRQAGGRRVLAVVNTSDKPATLSLDLGAFGQSTWAAAFGGHEVKVRTWRVGAGR